MRWRNENFCLAAEVHVGFDCTFCVLFDRVCCRLWQNEHSCALLLAPFNEDDGIFWVKPERASNYFVINAHFSCYFTRKCHASLLYVSVLKLFLFSFSDHIELIAPAPCEFYQMLRTAKDLLLLVLNAKHQRALWFAQNVVRISIYGHLHSACLRPHLWKCSCL